MLGGRVFDYAAGQFLVVTVDLPLTSHITAAAAAEPFLAFSLPLDPPAIAQLLLESHLPAPATPEGPALATSDGCRARRFGGRGRSPGSGTTVRSD